MGVNSNRDQPQNRHVRNGTQDKYCDVLIDIFLGEFSSLKPLYRCAKVEQS